MWTIHEASVSGLIASWADFISASAEQIRESIITFNVSIFTFGPPTSWWGHYCVALQIVARIAKRVDVHDQVVLSPSVLEVKADRNDLDVVAKGNSGFD
jgi:hypothetical protein